jgi:hypothetical protein
VGKKDGKQRLVIDYRKVNAVTVADVTSQRLVLLDLSVFFYKASEDPLLSCTS